MKRTAFLLGLLVVALGKVSAQKSPAAGKIVIYNEISDDPFLDRAGRNAYAGRYHVIDIKRSSEFTPARLKGASGYIDDPRPMREMGVPAKAVIVFVVTPEGLVKEPHLIQSTDQRVANHLIELMTLRRFAPARLRGVPVFSLYSSEAVFERGRDRDSGLFKNGLGIQGSRDR